MTDTIYLNKEKNNYGIDPIFPYTVKDAAYLINADPTSVLHLVKTGRIAAKQIEKCIRKDGKKSYTYRILGKDLIEYIVFLSTCEPVQVQEAKPKGKVGRPKKSSESNQGVVRYTVKEISEKFRNFDNIIGKIDSEFPFIDSFDVFFELMIICYPKGVRIVK